MSENQTQLLLLSGNIHANHIIGVNIDSLITNDDLFEGLSRLIECSKYMQTRISNIKLVFPSDEERVFIWIVLRTTFLNFEHKESELLHVLVCEEVEQLIFFIIDDFLDDRDFIFVVEIVLEAEGGVYVETIFLGGCHEDALIIV